MSYGALVTVPDPVGGPGAVEEKLRGVFLDWLSAAGESRLAPSEVDDLVAALAGLFPGEGQGQMAEALREVEQYLCHVHNRAVLGDYPEEDLPGDTKAMLAKVRAGLSSPIPVGPEGQERQDGDG